MLHLHQKSTYTMHIYIYICICNTHTHPFLHAKYAPIISISSPAFSFTSSCAMEALEAMTTELGVPGWLMVLPRCNSRVGSTWPCYRSFKAWQPKISVTKLVLLTNHLLFGVPKIPTIGVNQSAFAIAYSTHFLGELKGIHLLFNWRQWPVCSSPKKLVGNKCIHIMLCLDMCIYCISSIYHLSCFYDS